MWQNPLDCRFELDMSNGTYSNDVVLLIPHCSTNKDWLKKKKCKVTSRVQVSVLRLQVESKTLFFEFKSNPSQVFKSDSSYILAWVDRLRFMSLRTTVSFSSPAAFLFGWLVVTFISSFRSVSLHFSHAFVYIYESIKEIMF